MLPSKSEIQETLQTLGWGDGSAVHFYDENMRETTASVHKVLGLGESSHAPETWNALVKKVRVEGGGLKTMLWCWLKGLQGK